MDEDREILAGEYVLGTLDAGERAQAERLIASDTAFAARVRYWEGRLSALSNAVEPVEPPQALWSRILGALPAAGGAQIIDLTRRLKRWQTATYIAGAIAAALLVFVGVREAYQPRLPEGGKFVAVLQQDKVSPGFLLTVDLRTKEFTRAALSAYDPQTINEATYAVSVEPPGGSPTGVATGPIVYVGKLIEAVP
jgi:anti-sigma-K factor RskA